MLFPYGPGDTKFAHRPTILNTSCSYGVYILFFQPSAMFSGQNHWNIIEFARAYWSPCSFFFSSISLVSYPEDLRPLPITNKGPQLKRQHACVFYCLSKHLVSFWKTTSSPAFPPFLITPKKIVPTFPHSPQNLI